MDWFPLWLSLRVATLATLISAMVGLPLAWWLAHGKFRGKGLLDALVTLPLVLPPTVLGYYLLIVIGRNSAFGSLYESATGGPLVFTWQGAVVAAVLHSLPSGYWFDLRTRELLAGEPASERRREASE